MGREGNGRRKLGGLLEGRLGLITAAVTLMTAVVVLVGTLIRPDVPDIPGITGDGPVTSEDMTATPAAVGVDLSGKWYEDLYDEDSDFWIITAVESEPNVYGYEDFDSDGNPRGQGKARVEQNVAGLYIVCVDGFTKHYFGPKMKATLTLDDDLEALIGRVTDRIGISHTFTLYRETLFEE